MRSVRRLASFGAAGRALRRMASEQRLRLGLTNVVYLKAGICDRETFFVLFGADGRPDGVSLDCRDAPPEPPDLRRIERATERSIAQADFAEEMHRGRLFSLSSDCFGRTQQSRDGWLLIAATSPV
jgi:hypothetical protein